VGLRSSGFNNSKGGMGSVSGLERFVIGGGRDALLALEAG